MAALLHDEADRLGTLRSRLCSSSSASTAEEPVAQARADCVGMQMQPEQASGSEQPSSRADWGLGGSAFSTAAPEAGAPPQVLPFPATAASHALEDYAV